MKKVKKSATTRTFTGLPEEIWGKLAVIAKKKKIPRRELIARILIDYVREQATIDQR